MDKPLNGREYVRKLVNIAYICIGGPLLVFIWIYLEVLSDRHVPVIDSAYELNVFLAILLIGLALWFFGYYRGKKIIAEAQQSDNLVFKLTTYKKKIRLQHINYGIISGLVTIGFYLTGYRPFEFLFFVMIFLVSIHQPNATRTVKDLGLKDVEKDILTRGLDF